MLPHLYKSPLMGEGRDPWGQGHTASLPLFMREECNVAVTSNKKCGV